MIKLSQEVSNTDTKLEKTNIGTAQYKHKVHKYRTVTKTNIESGIKKKEGPGLFGR